VFESASESLAFRTKGCTWSAVEIGKGDYLVTMLDPEERFPIGVKTTLTVNLQKTWKAFDGVTSQELTAEDNKININIEPAGFRLIRVIEQ
jgi:hypothetical protein